ncbi:MAG TPA: 3-hydroxyacyl-CoA dehydrogenase NAD-binding domain-containing protein, partial [Candidatus Limnocylindria bacterium]
MSIDRVFVIGAGLMGHGIAQVSAAAGKRVTLSDRTAELAEKGKARIGANLERQVEKGKLQQSAADDVLARIGTSEGTD